jgi:acetoin utilization deacetylase AcuC-like enzyme
MTNLREENRDRARKMGLIFFPAFDWAITPTHPEREERLLYTRDQIFEEGLMDLPEVEEYKPRLAELKDIARVHFCIPSVESLVTEAHLIAAGSTLVLADAYMKKEITNAFALVRPPGHHSMRVAHGNRGFCNVNNEAIMVEYIRRKYGIRRVAIIDTDVHHGDGTQEIFYHDPDVLFISFHQDGRTLYPGSGFVDEQGGPKAIGRTINIPLPPETPDEGILYVLEELVLPILKEFRPQLVVNSAGQDNHYTDPLANMRFSAQGYAKLNEMLAPDIAVLEGGYAIETALPYVNTGIILAMAGLDYSNVREPDFVPGKFTMSRTMEANITGTVEYLQEIWEAREELTAKAVERAGPFFRRHKNIFYDTDGIREKQTESVKMCPDKSCPGYMTIDTDAVRGYGMSDSGFGVFVPLFACKRCREEAREEYETHKTDSRYNYVFFQDKNIDNFRLYSTRAHNERVY